MSLRIILTSARALDVVLAALAGVALALAFPKANLAWLAPLGAAALFWLWNTASWKRAFWLGWLAGTIFFGISFSWFGYTVGAYLGSWSPTVTIVPAIVEGFFIALTGAAASLAYRWAPPALAPLAAAAAFPVFECLRSIGWTAVPFAQLGYSQANTPLALFAAYGGTYGVTFIVCVAGAYLADAMRFRRSFETPSGLLRMTKRLTIVLAVIAIAWNICWFAWPARRVDRLPHILRSSDTNASMRVATTPAMRVAIIQGNIAQSLKWNPASVPLAIDRYITMTRAAKSSHPQFIVWPETVIPEVLNRDPITEQKFSRLSQEMHATLVVGAQEYAPEGIYNALYIFTPTGNLQAIYQKRQLVPFAESLPAKKYLGWLPYISDLAGTFANGTVDGVYAAGEMHFAPMICWESAFADLAHHQIQNGAQFFIVATDDAWFGETAGPAMHAEIAQLRAIENGTWIARAAATGISGIIAPTGAYTSKTNLDEQTAIIGNIGPPAKTLFSYIGPTPIIILFTILYLAIVLPGTRLRRQWQGFGERLTPSRSHGGRE